MKERLKPRKEDLVMLHKAKASAGITAEQVLRKLVEFEENAAEFYQGLHDGTDSAYIKKFARTMVEAEKRHARRFQAYAEHARKHDHVHEYELDQTLPAPLKRTIEGKFWPTRERIQASARYSADADFIKLAIRAEENYAMLLTELRMFAPPRQKAYMTRVINEETVHKQKLEAVLKKVLRDRPIL